MHVEKAQQRGVPREKISAALALTGIKKAHRLDLLEPTDPQQQVNEFTPRGFYTPSGIVEIIPPHLATFFESVLPKNQVNSFWPIESQKTPPVNKKKIISGLKTLYRETLAAGDIGIPLTQQAFAERYSSAASPETKTSKTKLNRQQAAAVASAQILFPEFNRRFFEEAVLQRSPFSPLFYFDFLPDSGSLAKRIKSASCNTTETRERLLDSLIEVNQLPKEPDKFAPRIYPCREHYFQLLFHSRFNYPEDETLWHLIETELIPPLINNSGQTVEMETNGGLTIKGLPNQVIPVIFFRNYLEIKENTAALKPDQAKKKIAAALSEWQEAIKRLKVPVTEHQL